MQAVKKSDRSNRSSRQGMTGCFRRKWGWPVVWMTGFAGDDRMAWEDDRFLADRMRGIDWVPGGLECPTESPESEHRIIIQPKRPNDYVWSSLKIKFHVILQKLIIFLAPSAISHFFSHNISEPVLLFYFFENLNILLSKNIRALRAIFDRKIQFYVQQPVRCLKRLRDFFLDNKHS